MFSDLVGSTALSRRLDPEDLREVIAAYHRCVEEAVARFGGFVAKYMGDGVLVHFGYPQAHEDDAERAVRAGLGLVGATGELEAPERLRVRLGIASGLVVVGDLIGSGAAQLRGSATEVPTDGAGDRSGCEPPEVRKGRRHPVQGIRGPAVLAPRQVLHDPAGGHCGCSKQRRGHRRRSRHC
jgi:hypothetical protein